MDICSPVINTTNEGYERQRLKKFYAHDVVKQLGHHIYSNEMQC
jgi:hypothetical protein